MLTGALRKMRSELNNSIVHYQLPIGDHLVELNQLIGSELRLRFVGEIHCIQCDRKTNKSFQQGYCFPCYRKLGECGYCMVQPLKCHSQYGPCDDSQWAHANCNVDHVIYLANTSALKVGITRVTQMPTRWIDQGAVQALPIFTVQNRYHSGVVEAELAKLVADKTNWRAMLKGAPESLDLTAERDRLMQQSSTELEKYATEFTLTPVTDTDVVSIEFPVSQYPEKIATHNFDKTPEIHGTLVGIKGQYLMLDTGVLNIRKFGGYRVEINAPQSH